MKSCALAIAFLAIAAIGTAQESLGAAKELYASAAYEEALSALTRLNAAGAPDGIGKSEVDVYRAFCLFALGRTAEAKSVAESLLAKDPLLELDPRDASPRIVAMFDAMRTRVLPRVIREEYKTVRAAIDRKEFADARPGLLHVRRLLDEAERSGVSDEALADLRVLVDGFIELTNAVVETRAEAEQAALRASAASARPAAVDPLYDSSSTEVTAPVVVSQQVPPVPPALRPVMKAGRAGVLDLVIDARGNVERAVMRDSVNAIYDKLVLTAARSWKYQPATRNGTPVRYQKSVVLTLE